MGAVSHLAPKAGASPPGWTPGGASASWLGFPPSLLMALGPAALQASVTIGCLHFPCRACPGADAPSAAPDTTPQARAPLLGTGGTVVKRIGTVLAPWCFYSSGPGEEAADSPVRQRRKFTIRALKETNSNGVT